jgi:transposase InsO family protein
VAHFITWLSIGPSKYYDWQCRYGKANEHNSLIPRDFWLEDWEKQAIVDFHLEHPLEGYRRLAFMMLDHDVVAVSPSSVYRVLSAADLLRRWNGKSSKKGTGSVQPLKPHEHWHIDISYINLCGTFYYLCSILDGCSRYIVHWELRETMTEKDVEIILQRAREKFIRYYNEERLHSSLGYVAPKDKLEGRDKQIFTERDKKLEAAREARKQKRQEGKQRPALQHQAPRPGEIFNSLTQQGQLSISG